MQHRSRRRLATLASSAALFALVSTWVAAQSGPGTANALVPYQGYLESGGVAVTTPVDLRVGLFSSSAPGTADCLAESSLSGCGVWADEMTDVPVSDGRFSVLLGSGLALPDGVFANDALYVGVAVAPPDGSYTVLGGLQRLASVPYTVRAETSSDLFVRRSITVAPTPPAIGEVHVDRGSLYVRDGDDDPEADIAQFFANNLTQGIGLGYNRIEAVGANASQDLVLRAKGTGLVYVDGSATVASALTVEGGATIAGTLTAEDALHEPVIRNRNGTTSVYYRDGGRQLFEATYQNAAPTRRWVSVPESVLVSYCADEDGCTIRLGMRNWSNGISASTSAGPFHFSYGSSLEGSTRRWRASTGTEGHDGNGGDVQHVRQEYDCYFTDGFYTVGGGGNDNSRGMGLLNWNYAGYTGDCWLIIDD